jgi:hypothetical protein
VLQRWSKTGPKGQRRHHERAILGGLRAIDHQQIAWLHLLISRHIALDPHEEGGSEVVDQVLVRSRL